MSKRGAKISIGACGKNAKINKQEGRLFGIQDYVIETSHKILSPL